VVSRQSVWNHDPQALERVAVDNPLHDPQESVASLLSNVAFGEALEEVRVVVAIRERRLESWDTTLTMEVVRHCWQPCPSIELFGAASAPEIHLLLVSRLGILASQSKVSDTETVKYEICDTVQ
jgi:hypothetical protein